MVGAAECDFLIGNGRIFLGGLELVEGGNAVSEDLTVLVDRELDVWSQHAT